MDNFNNQHFEIKEEPTLKQKKDKQTIINMMLTILIVISLGMNVYFLFFQSDTNASSNLNQVSQNNAKIEQVNYDVKTNTTEVIKEVSDSVVGIVVFQQGQQASSGSGVVFKVDGKDTYVITNHHVIESGSRYQVVFSNQESVEASLVGSDRYSDIAVLKLTADFEVTAMKIGDSDLLDTGETVLAIGSPLGIEYAGTATQGIVSATNRTVSVDLNNDNNDDWDMNVIQTDAAINPGNSGGAFVNMAGELVGITSMKFSDTSVEGMGFALPINDVMQTVTEILETGEVSRPTLGISGASLSDFSTFELRYYQINTKQTDGIYIAKVQDGSAASKAGLEVGDIITEMDGKEITTYKSFLTELYKKKPGDTIKLVIYRNDKKQTVSVTLQ